MPRKVLIQIIRGTEEELKAIILETGELAFTTDTLKLFIGSEKGNLLLAQGILP